MSDLTLTLTFHPDPDPDPDLALILTAALEQVSDAAVDEYFAPLGERELELPEP